MRHCTNYIKQKRCLNCWHLNDDSLAMCAECGYFFVKEATEEERKKASMDIENRQFINRVNNI